VKGPFTLRTRLTLVVGATTALAIVAAISAASVVTRQQLMRTVDASLRDAPLRPEFDDRGPINDRRDRDRSRQGVDYLIQVLDANGVPQLSTSSIDLPVTDADRRVAGSGREELLRTERVEGERFRVFTRPIRGGAIQIARSLSETDDTLAAVRRRMLALGSLGVALAALAAWIVGSRESRPIRRLTTAAEQVAASQDLTVTMPTAGSSEVARLSNSMSTMLGALDVSRRQQQRLIQDASHELRTPLTSLRANIELLRRYDELSPADRSGIAEDLQRESHELTALVSEMVELATDHRLAEAPQPVDVHEAVCAIAAVFERRSGRSITITDQRAVVDAPVELTLPVARVTQMERAISNLVDNALKFSPPETAVEITVGDRHVEVRDHGEGIPEADLPRVFDRFYRSDATRTMPGSGLGLAIVQQFATDHQGTTFASNHPDGGAIVGFSW
jgi:two-component system, OmpR family, sensor histidine kinase MprB